VTAEQSVIESASSKLIIIVSPMPYPMRHHAAKLCGPAVPRIGRVKTVVDDKANKAVSASFA